MKGYIAMIYKIQNVQVDFHKTLDQIMFVSNKLALWEIQGNKYKQL